MGLRIAGLLSKQNTRRLEAHSHAEHGLFAGKQGRTLRLPNISALSTPKYTGDQRNGLSATARHVQARLSTP